MAIPRAYQFQKSKFDINKNQTIGLAFPLINAGNFTRTNNLSEQIKANIINVLLTERGERPMQPDFGVGLKNLLFENSVDEDTLLENINNQTSFFMPEISVESTKIERELDLYRLSISITYSINNEKNDDSIQINFR